MQSATCLHYKYHTVTTNTTIARPQKIFTTTTTTCLLSLLRHFFLANPQHLSCHGDGEFINVKTVDVASFFFFLLLLLLFSLSEQLRVLFSFEMFEKGNTSAQGMYKLEEKFQQKEETKK